MADLQLKQEIHEYVDRADKQLLKLIYVMMKEYEKNGELLDLIPLVE